MDISTHTSPSLPPSLPPSFFSCSLILFSIPGSLEDFLPSSFSLSHTHIHLPLSLCQSLRIHPSIHPSVHLSISTILPPSLPASLPPSLPASLCSFSSPACRMPRGCNLLPLVGQQGRPPGCRKPLNGLLHGAWKRPCSRPSGGILISSGKIQGEISSVSGESRPWLLVCVAGGTPTARKDYGNASAQDRDESEGAGQMDLRPEVANSLSPALQCGGDFGPAVPRPRQDFHTCNRRGNEDVRRDCKGESHRGLSDRIVESPPDLKDLITGIPHRLFLSPLHRPRAFENSRADLCGPEKTPFTVDAVERTASRSWASSLAGVTSGRFALFFLPDHPGICLGGRILGRGWSS